MNIIYMLENKQKQKFYIGQKVECRVEEVNGLRTIINNKTELPYYGSSSNIEMQQDLLTDKFEAHILEIVNDKTKMCEREEYYIRQHKAVELDTYYNLSYPLHYNKRDFQNSIKNEFGETYKEYAANESAISKRINSAKKIGFNTLEDFYLDVYKQLNKTQNLAEIARHYNVERHTISRLLKDVNINNFYNQTKTFSKRLKNNIIDLRVRGASIKRIAFILNQEFATILYYIGSDKIRNKSFLVAKRNNLTEDELGYKIMKLFLENKGIDEISKELSLTTLQTNRYFHKFIRKHIEINDFNGILKE